MDYSEGAASSSRSTALARAFASLADSLVADYDVLDLLERLVGHSIALLPVDAAGLMLADDTGRLRAVASSGRSADAVERLQLHAGEGPCLTCFHTAAPVSAPDLITSDRRWPRFSAAVLDHGSFASIHSVPLRLRGQTIGALNLLHHVATSPSPDDLAVAQALADIATNTILSQRVIERGKVVAEQLQTALDSRTVIEQAKGLLVGHTGLDADDAFGLLRRFARARGLLLTQVARLIATRQLDPAVIVSHARTPPPPADGEPLPGTGS